MLARTFLPPCFVIEFANGDWVDSESACLPVYVTCKTKATAVFNVIPLLLLLLPCCVRIYSFLVLLAGRVNVVVHPPLHISNILLFINISASKLTATLFGSLN